MAAPFLGAYLVEQGVITPAQLDEAVAHQQDANRRFGDLAVEKGLLSEPQVQAIFQAQKRRDLPFGKTAMRLGLLTRDQVDDLLFSQTVGSCYLGEALLAKGFLSEAEYARVMDAFACHERDKRRDLGEELAQAGREGFLTELVRALERAYTRFVGRGFKITGVATAFGDAFEAAYGLRVDLEDGEPLRAVVLVRGDMTERAAKAMPSGGLAEFFAVVCRYFEENLRRKGLDVAGAELDGPHPAAETDCGEGLKVLLGSPAGPLGVAMRCRRPAAGDRP